MKRRIFAALLAGILAVCAFAGCSGKTENSKTESSKTESSAPAESSTPAESSAEESKAEETGSVYWLNFKPEADKALNEIAATYKTQTGVEVKVITAASGTYEQTLTAEMGKTAAPTLFVVGNTAAVGTWKDYCLDLTGTSIANELNTDAYNLYDESGKLCSIGYTYECYGIIVNVELLEKAGHKLDEIKNFETLKAVAEDIHARAAELGFDAFTSSGMDDSSSWRFSGHLANMPLYYESVDDKWTECPAEIKGTYLDNFKMIWDLYTENAAVDKATLATGGYDAEAEFGKGNAVFYQNGSWEFANLVKDEEKGFKMDASKLAMIPIYCGVEGEENAGLCCGTENCWAVNAKASEADQKATLDFMTWLVTSEEGTKMMADQFGPIPYKKAAAPENTFFANATEYANAGKYTVTWAFNYTPNVNDWRATLVAAMNQYDAGKAWDDVVTAFVKGWAAQYKAANAG